MHSPPHAPRRLFYEVRDWCRGVRDEPTHAAHSGSQTAQHSPEVWVDG